MHPIIILWAHPRSMSTAMERVMRERGDLVCFHEPFLYHYYMNNDVRTFPHFDVEPDRPKTYEAIRDMLLDAAQDQPVFAKDMSYYVLSRLLADDGFDARLTNAFLIRDPVAAILSYFKLDPDFSLDELGYESQATHFRALTDRGEAPVILQAEAVQADPPAMIGAFWRAIGLPPADHAFAWDGAQPKDWGHVGGWHKDVSSSNGIRPLSRGQHQARQDSFAELAAQHPRLQKMLDHHLPFYEFLRSNALVI